MLSRYRSVSAVDQPGSYNSPVQRFEEAAEHRQWLLQQRLGEGFIRDGGLRTALRLWTGPLQGIAHQAGQFMGLEEGPAGESVPLPPEVLAQGLSMDLELLEGLAELTRDVLYGAYGSESDFNVVPIILEPRLREGTAAPSVAPPAPPPPPALPLQDATLSAAPLEAVEGGGCVGRGIDVGDSGAGGGAGGGWWSLEEAVATPLSWPEVAASLGVPPALAARMPEPHQFTSRAEFQSYMHQKHISRLEGGSEQSDGGSEDAPAASGGPRVAVAAAAAAPPSTETGAEPQGRRSGADCRDAKSAAAVAAAAVTKVVAAGDACEAEAEADKSEVAGPGRPRTAAAALAAAVRALSDAFVFPGPLQVVLGSEEGLGWNPVPLMWVGRSGRSGAIVGLLTAVVWT